MDAKTSGCPIGHSGGSPISDAAKAPRALRALLGRTNPLAAAALRFSAEPTTVGWH